METALETAVSQTSRTHNLARNQRLLRVLALAHLLAGRGLLGAHSVPRRARAWWNEPSEDEPEPVHALPCSLELPIRGRWQDVTIVCGAEMDAPREVDPDEGELVELLHLTDAALEAYEEPHGLCRAFEESVHRVVRNRPGPGGFQPNPRVVEDGFRCYRQGALAAIEALRESLSEPSDGSGENGSAEGWPEPGTAGFRRLQRRTLRGYEATLVSTGVSHALLGEVQAFADDAYGR